MLTLEHSLSPSRKSVICLVTHRTFFCTAGQRTVGVLGLTNARHAWSITSHAKIESAGGRFLSLHAAVDEAAVVVRALVGGLEVVEIFGVVATVEGAAGVVEMARVDEPAGVVDNCRFF